MTTEMLAVRRTLSAAIKRQDCSESRPPQPIVIPAAEWARVLERLDWLERRVRDLRAEAAA